MSPTGPRSLSPLATRKRARGLSRIATRPKDQEGRIPLSISTHPFGEMLPVNGVHVRCFGRPMDAPLWGSGFWSRGQGGINGSYLHENIALLENTMGWG